MSDAFVPGWDKEPGVRQHRQRIDERLAMGDKITPKGPARLICAK